MAEASDNEDGFREAFRELTKDEKGESFDPMAWQIRLYRDYFAKGEIPSRIDLPTGLGKTMVMAIWLIAISEQLPTPKLPRRLIYVVDRRTVVDQATPVVVGCCGRARIARGPRSRVSSCSLTPSEWLR